jgi:soluble lytic murein transglycosylase
VADYDGSYILTFAAYNAGPRRAREWIAQYGDPRAPGVDPIDWVESVPFTETRKYIQKVLQNIHVYRSRIEPKTVVPMTVDLRRGSSRKLTQTAGGEKSTSCASEALSLDSLIHSC